MEAIDFSNIPYSQHHREASMMLGGPVNMSVFTYLLDEYLYRLRTGKGTTFKLSRNNIAETQNINRVTVRNTLPKLEAMRLITIDGKNITVNGDIYASLIYAFHNLPNKEEKQEFANYLQTGQFSPLKDMGYEETGQFSPLLSAMSGGLDKINQSENETGQNYPVSTNNNRDMVKINQSGDKTGQNYPPRLDKINQSEETIDQICAFLGISSDSDEGKELISMTCGEKEDISDESKLAIFNQFVPKILVKINQEGWLKLTTRNKYNKDKKIKYHDFDEKDVFEQDENSLEQDSKSFKQDEEEQETFVTLRKGGKHYKKKSYPYFPASVVKEIISDINNCLDNDCKLYLWNFNQELHSRYDVDEVVDDETGDTITEASTDDSQFVIRKSEFEDMKLKAFDSTQEMIENGFEYIEGKKYNFTATMTDPERLEEIIDWEFKYIGDGEKVCEVDWSRIQNPDEEEIEEVELRPSRRRRNREEIMRQSQENQKYITTVLDNGDTDENFEAMSPMEKVIYSFVLEFYKLKEDSNEIDLDQDMKYLNRNAIWRFFAQEREKRPDTPSIDDFVSMFAVDKRDQYGGVQLRHTMFSAARIRNWNKKRGYKSVC